MQLSSISASTVVLSAVCRQNSRGPTLSEAGGATIAFSLPQRNTIFAALLIAGVFLAFSGDGLRAYFTPDDMMNLYGACFRRLAESDRPVGALFYRALFTAFG